MTNDLLTTDEAIKKALADWHCSDVVGSYKERTMSLSLNEIQALAEVDARIVEQRLKEGDGL